MKKNTNKGFTLVELAIVLVIIGLLVGGVLQGQELIKQAQIRNVLSSLNQYDAAVNTFRAKYNNALPGDFNKSSSFGLNGTTANCSPTADGVAQSAITTTAGCNGDNNGFLADTSGGSSTAALTGEVANFWVHLSNAGLVKGSYSQASASVAVGTAYPRSTIGTGVVAVSEGRRLYYVVGTGTTIATLGQATAAAAANSTIGNSLTPPEAYAIDSKLDDGVPNNGIVKVIEGYSAAGVFDSTIATMDTATCNDDATTPYAYNVSLGTKVCTINVRASS